VQAQLALTIVDIKISVMKKVFFLIVFTTTYQWLSAQNVGIGTTTPQASAQLDVTSTTKGILIPRMTTAQRTAIATPVPGLLVFDNTSSSFWFYNGSSWTEFLTTSTSGWGY
jgi:hypothetical protein